MKTYSIMAAALLMLGGAGRPADATAATLTPLPEGDTGIAARYPRDAGIGSDPSVLFHDDFEGTATAAELPLKWNAGVWQPGLVRIAEEPGNVHAGQRAVEMTLPVTTTELGDALCRWVAPEQDVVHLRFYAKYQPGFSAPYASRHDGGEISAHYMVNGQATPGVPANGTNKFLANFECFPFDTTFPQPGPLNIYCYWPEQFGNYGDSFLCSGTVYPNSYARSGAATFGPEFVSRPDIVPELGTWQCYEYMLQANTVGLRDGRIACWLDGKLIADFPNLWFRSIDTLKIDHVAIGLFMGSNEQQNQKWYDDVVVATSYIGPISSPQGGSGGGGGGGGCAASGGRSGPGSWVFLLLVILLATRRLR